MPESSPLSSLSLSPTLYEGRERQLPFIGRTETSQKKAVAVNEPRDVARIREATAKLRAAGIANPEKVLRLGAAEMVERCLARFAGEPKLLARAILDGGVIFDEQRGGRRETASDLLRLLGGSA